jgi:hypothetical protein
VTHSISGPQRGLTRWLLAGLMPALFLAATVGGADTARAVPFFTVTGGTSFVTAGEAFQWVGPRFSSGEQTDLVLLWEGFTLGLSEPGFITLEYIGKEAAFADNIFRWNGTQIFTTGPGTPQIQGQIAASPFPPVALETYVVPGQVNAGPLPFSFFITEFGTEVLNNGNLDIAIWPIPADLSGNPINFGTTVYLLLDDEAVIDTDHDDMIVRLTVTPVPEPGMLALAAVAALPLAGWFGARRQQGKRPLTGGHGVFSCPLDGRGGGG